MKLGCQTAPTNDTHLKYLARYGVRNICGYPEIADGRLYATVDELKRMRDLAEKIRHQRRLHRAAVSGLQPYRPREASRHHAGESPERDRDIEALQTLIRNCAAAGIPSIKYNMSILGVLRLRRARRDAATPPTAPGG